MSVHISDSITLGDNGDGTTPNHPRILQHSVLTPDNVSADEGDASLLTNPLTYLPWVAETDGVQNVTVELESPDTVNAFGIVGHNLHGAIIELHSSADGSGWNDVEDTQLIPGDNHALVVEFADTTAKWFRLNITPVIDTPPRIAVWKLGRVLRLQRRIFVGHKPAPLNAMVDVSTGRSEDGAYLGRVVRSRRYQDSVSLQNLTPAWVRSRLKPTLDAAEVDTFFWCWRPQDYPHDVIYSWLTGDPEYSNARTGISNQAATFSLEGLR